MIFIVIYTPQNEGERNIALEQAIKAYPQWAIVSRNVFIVNDNQTESKVIADRLSIHLKDNTEKLLVAQITRPISWRNHRTDFGDWLRKNFNASQDQTSTS